MRSRRFCWKMYFCVAVFRGSTNTSPSRVFFWFPRCLCCTPKTKSFPTGTAIRRNDTVSVTISLVPGYLTSRLPPKMERSKPRMLRPDMARFYFCFDFGLNIDRRLEFGQSSTFFLILESAPSDHGFMDRNDGQEDSWTSGTRNDISEWRLSSRVFLAKAWWNLKRCGMGFW